MKPPTTQRWSLDGWDDDALGVGEVEGNPTVGGVDGASGVFGVMRMSLVVAHRALIDLSLFLLDLR
jgi:hypothetical protein